MNVQRFRSPRRGITAVAVLVCLVVVTLISGALLKVGLAHRAAVRAQERRIQAEWLAQAGLDRALFRLAASAEEGLDLFAEAPTAVELASLGAEGIEAHIKSLGLAPTKARNVAATASILVERYGRTGKEDGDLPLDVSREELESLPGVGRKTASVVLAMSGLVQALPVDTHIHRLSQRWGFSRAGASVLQVEADLCAAFGQNDGIRGQWDKLHLRLIYFGREHCPAQRHARAECPICSWAGV